MIYYYKCAAPSVTVAPGDCYENMKEIAYHCEDGGSSGGMYTYGCGFYSFDTLGGDAETRVEAGATGANIEARDPQPPVEPPHGLSCDAGSRTLPYSQVGDCIWYYCTEVENKPILPVSMLPIDDFVGCKG